VFSGTNFRDPTRFFFLKTPLRISSKGVSTPFFYQQGRTLSWEKGYTSHTIFPFLADTLCAQHLFTRRFGTFGAGETTNFLWCHHRNHLGANAGIIQGTVVISDLSIWGVQNNTGVGRVPEHLSKKKYICLLAPNNISPWRGEFYQHTACMTIPPKYVLYAPHHLYEGGDFATPYMR